MISPINFANIHHNQINNKQQNNKQTINNLNQLNCDTVCFTGAVKVLSDVCDKAFVDILTKDLELNKESATKLKNTVWNFLRENKIQSLGEIGGDEHFDEQLKLQEKITKVLKIDENDDFNNQYIADEIINRCDNGKDYIPLGKKGYIREESLFDQFKDGKTFATGMKECLDVSNDNEFYIFAKKMLRQNPEESYEFRNTIDEFLKENNLKSITELFSDEDLINEQACLIEQLENKFNISETESSALHFAFLDRANTNPFVSNFSTEISPFIKDLDPINKIVENNGLEEHKIGFWKLNQALFREMSAEAEEKDLENVFELFKPENNFSQSKTYKFIKEKSGLSEEEQTDLILDFAKVAQDPEAFASNIPKWQAKDNFYANIQVEMIKDELAKQFLDAGFETEEEISAKAIKDIIYKMFPKHVHGGQDCDAKQVAFELADGYNLPAGAEEKIEKIINKVISGGTQSADVYAFAKLKSDLGIE